MVIRTKEIFKERDSALMKVNKLTQIVQYQKTELEELKKLEEEKGQL